MASQYLEIEKSFINQNRGLLTPLSLQNTLPQIWKNLINIRRSENRYYHFRLQSLQNSEGVVHFPVFAHGIYLQTADRVIKYPILNALLISPDFEYCYFIHRMKLSSSYSYCIICGIALYKSLLFLLSLILFHAFFLFLLRPQTWLFFGE